MKLVRLVDVSFFFQLNLFHGITSDEKAQASETSLNLPDKWKNINE